MPDVNVPGAFYRQVNLFAEYKKVREELEELKKKIADATIPPFTEGQIVNVDHPSYRGKGVVYHHTGVRRRMIGVRLQHGYVRQYEVDTVSLIDSFHAGE